MFHGKHIVRYSSQDAVEQITQRETAPKAHMTDESDGTASSDLAADPNAVRTESLSTESVRSSSGRSSAARAHSGVRTNQKRTTTAAWSLLLALIVSIGVFWVVPYVLGTPAVDVEFTASPEK